MYFIFFKKRRKNYIYKKAQNITTGQFHEFILIYVKNTA